MKKVLIYSYVAEFCFHHQLTLFGLKQSSSQMFSLLAMLMIKGVYRKFISDDYLGYKVQFLVTVIKGMKYLKRFEGVHWNFC